MPGLAHEHLEAIDVGAHDPNAPLPSLLRRCLALGGITGRDTLRIWATQELKGYDAIMKSRIID